MARAPLTATIKHTHTIKEGTKFVPKRNERRREYTYNYVKNEKRREKKKFKL